MTIAKSAASVARNADAELEALFAAINDVILVLDAEGRYVKIAPTNPSLLYRPAAELLGKTLREVFDGAHAEQFMGYIRTALETRTTVHFEYSLPIGGRDVWFSGAISPMSGDQVVLVGPDITERRPERRTRGEFPRRHGSEADREDPARHVRDLGGRPRRTHAAGPVRHDPRDRGGADAGEELLHRAVRRRGRPPDLPVPCRRVRQRLPVQAGRQGIDGIRAPDRPAAAGHTGGARGARAARRGRADRAALD